jgi:RNA polymerase sigma factor (sigma-70 family)
MDHMQSDADLIARSLREPEAFAAIFDRHHESVHGFLRRRVGPELADDWLGETFAQAFRARGRYVPRHDTCRAWLLGIASHLVANHRRAEQRRLLAIRREAGRSRAEASAEADEIVARLAARAVSAELVEGLRALDKRDRDVLLLYAWGDLSYTEIAEALELPVGTVRSRLHRARALIRKRLALPDHPEPSRERPLVASTGEHHA